MYRTNLFIFLVLIFTARFLYSQLTAFPEAEGFGKYSVGGRGGKIIEVTNLNNSGTGSLRAAIDTKGARIIVFRVSGTIVLQSKLEIKNDSVTIAGQTAPGDGICLRKYPLSISANHVVIRYLRCRLGDESPGEDDALSAFSGRKNIIIDHCSISWSIDEAMSCYGNENFTAQWNLISESLYNNHHSKGKHGYGGIWGGKNASFHHNLFAHHTSRNPRFAGGETPACVNVDYRNNVIFNWGANSAYGGEGGKINMVGNYYKYGPGTTSSKRFRIVELSENTGRWFIDSNYVTGNPSFTQNNWAGGVQGSFIRDSVRVLTPFPFEPIKMHYGTQLFQVVMKNVGAVLPVRDIIDKRIIQETETGVCTFSGSQWVIDQGFSDTTIKRGIIDTQWTVGGWPVLNSIPAPADDDHDGMPNQWESNHGLNQNNPEDRNFIAPSGYTYIEEYLNEIGAMPSSAEREYNFTNPAKIELYQNYPNPFNPETKFKYYVSNEKNEIVTLKIFNINGEEVKTIVNSRLATGIYESEWNANSLSSGIYLAKLSVGNTSKSIKVTLIK